MGRKEGLLRAISGFCLFRRGAFGDGFGFGLFGCAAIVCLFAYGVGLVACARLFALCFYGVGLSLN
jgi:hypothetical protein